MCHIFVSYSREDSIYAFALHRELENRGYEVWIDTRIDYGETWPRVIQTQIDKCSVFIIIMTAHSYQSDWVQNELARAQDKKKTIFPLLLEGEGPWLSVQTIQFVDVRDGKAPPNSFFKRLSDLISTGSGSTVESLLPGKSLVSLTLDLVTLDTKGIDNLISLISGLTNVGVEEIKLVDTRRGSLIVVFEMSKEAAQQLLELTQKQPEVFKEFNLIRTSISKFEEQRSRRQTSPRFKSTHFVPSSDPSKNDETFLYRKEQNFELGSKFWNPHDLFRAYPNRQLSRIVWLLTFFGGLALLLLFASVFFREYWLGLVFLSLSIATFATGIVAIFSKSWPVLIPGWEYWLVFSPGRQRPMRVLRPGMRLIKPIQSIIFYRRNAPITIDLAKIPPIPAANGIPFKFAGFVEFRFDPTLVAIDRWEDFLSLSETGLEASIMNRVIRIAQDVILSMSYSEMWRIGIFELSERIKSYLQEMSAFGIRSDSMLIQLEVPNDVAQENLSEWASIAKSRASTLSMLAYLGPEVEPLNPEIGARFRLIEKPHLRIYGDASQVTNIESSRITGRSVISLTEETVADLSTESALDPHRSSLPTSTRDETHTDTLGITFDGDED